jgi:hypothetical protein
MTKKESTFEKYVGLSKRLGRWASRRDCNSYGVSRNSIEYHFESLKNLRAEASKKYPFLEDLLLPLQVNESDVQKFRLGLDNKVMKSGNQMATSNTSFLDYVNSFTENVFKGRIKAPKTGKKPSRQTASRTVQLVLSDLHFGADLDKDETGVADFKAKQEARRLAHIVRETIGYKIEHRKNTSLKVLLLGDIIQNNLHDPRDGAPVAEQVCRAIHLLTQAVGQLAMHFPSIEVECQSGNHCRITSRHKMRAVTQKWDSFATIIYYAVKSACSNLKNVSFNIPKTPYTIYTVLGHKFLISHGDTFFKPGFPGNSVNIKHLENQMNKLNAALLDKDEIKVAILGHVHVGNVTYLPNGGTLVTNSCLLPADSYSVSLGSLENNSGQMIFETVKEFAFGDSRFIRVGENQDEDASLDAIISPWVAL